jgi:hypothetical protein
MRLAGTQIPPQRFAEEKRIDCRPINQSVPRLSEGRSSNEMVTDGNVFLKSIFMFGGAPRRRMLNSVVISKPLHRENLD